MRHYLCMGDGYLEYLGIKEHPRGAGEGRRRTVVRARRLINGDEPLGDAVHSLAEEWGLRGKRMELLAQDGVKRISRPLPKGKDRELRRMAENMLRAEEADIEQWEAAVEILYGNKEEPPLGIVYYIQRERLNRLRELLAREGIQPGLTFPYAGILSTLAEASEKSGAVLCIDLKETYVRFYGICRGCCICEKTSSLHPAAFIRMGGEQVLWEETAEMAEELIRCMEKTAPAEAVLLDRPFGPGAREAAAFFEKRLGLPCRRTDLWREGGPHKAGEGRKPAAFLSFSRETRGGWERAWRAFIFCNCLAAAAVFAVSAMRTQNADRELAAYRQSAEAEQSGETERRRGLERLALYQEAAEAAKERYGEKGEAGKQIQAVTKALEGRCRVDGIRYEQAEGILELRIRTDLPEAVLEAERLLEETGAFPRISHSMWERDEELGQIRAYLELRLGEEWTDEED